MKCPYCGYLESKVVDSRSTEDGNKIRRRRECLQCEKRFTTYEYVEAVPIVVIKKNKSREEFDKQKQKLMPGDAYNNDAATFGANGASDDDSATVAASDLDEGFDWICNSCQKQNPADSKCCSYCGGIKKIVGYTVIKDSPEAKSVMFAASLGLIV